MLKIVFFDPNLFYPSSEKRVFFMDPAIGWFQPEQCGPALSLWTDIWNTHQRINSFDFHSKLDSQMPTPSCLGSGNALLHEDRKFPLKKPDLNNTGHVCRGKRKENKASTYALSRNSDTISSGGTPWKLKEKLYTPGLLG